MRMSSVAVSVMAFKHPQTETCLQQNVDPSVTLTALLIRSRPQLFRGVISRSLKVAFSRVVGGVRFHRVSPQTGSECSEEPARGF